MGGQGRDLREEKEDLGKRAGRAPGRGNSQCRGPRAKVAQLAEEATVARKAWEDPRCGRGHVIRSLTEKT